MLTGDLLVLAVCREYGWTYDEYCSLPHWFANLAIEKFVIDSSR